MLYEFQKETISSQYLILGDWIWKASGMFGYNTIVQKDIVYLLEPTRITPQEIVIIWSIATNYYYHNYIKAKEVELIFHIGNKYNIKTIDICIYVCKRVHNCNI